MKEAEALENAEQALRQLGRLVTCHIQVWQLDGSCFEKDYPNTTFKSVIKEIVQDGGFHFVEQGTKRNCWIPLSTIDIISQT